MVISGFVSDIEDIAKSFGRDQCGNGPLAFNNRIRRQRGTVDHDTYVARFKTRTLQYECNALQYTLFRRPRCCENLCCRFRALVVNDNVGKRAAYIDSETHCLTLRRHILILLKGAHLVVTKRRKLAILILTEN